MKKLKPVNNSHRNTILTDYSQLESAVKKYPHKLFRSIKKHFARSKGTITVQHKGGRKKKVLRVVDSKRSKQDGIVGTVKSIEYDPYRTSFISLISYQNGSKSFILTPAGLKISDKILSGKSEEIPLEVGNNLPLSRIPVGT